MPTALLGSRPTIMESTMAILIPAELGKDKGNGERKVGRNSARSV